MSLTIEFAGITTLVWHTATNEAEVLLIDLEAAGFHRHQASLGVPAQSDIEAPDPDTSIAVPGSPMELGVWNLKGCTDIQVDGADVASLEVVADDINAAEPPAADEDSIKWLPEIGELCGSRTLSTRIPVAARMRIRSGRITATAARHPQIRAEFSDENRSLGPARYYLPRFMLELPGADISLRLDGKRTVTFRRDHEVMISNTCVCEPVFRVRGGHFYAHYLVTEPQRRPRMRSYVQGQGPMGPQAFAIPPSPDECFSAFFML
jgi:hypothetical protein